MLVASACFPLAAVAADRSIREERPAARVAAILLDVRPLAPPTHLECISAEEVELDQAMIARDAKRLFELEPPATKLSVDERTRRVYFDVLTSEAQQGVLVSVSPAFSLEPLRRVRFEKRPGVTRTALSWDLTGSKQARVPAGLYAIIAISGARVASGWVRVDRTP
jgi:hypothetical protein